ncbi:MAG: GAF domain-containing sensor histidine kinase [Dehalococcoidia bacterium]
MSRLRRYPFAKDPLREVRLLKRGVTVGACLAIVALLFLYLFAFHLSVQQGIFIFLTMALTVALAVELAFSHILRLTRASFYPVKLAVQLSPLQGFKEACHRSAQMVAELLQAEAVVVAWMHSDLRELEPLATAGLPKQWLKVAPHISLAESDLQDTVQRGQVITKRTATGDPWFSALGESYCVTYVPLLSLDRVSGVLALAGDSLTFSPQDHRLLTGIGVAVGLALDNARLYDRERKRAERLQELAQIRSDFLLTVSHELRTPLTSIKTSAEMLQEEDHSHPDSPQSRLIRSIVQGVSRLSTLVDDLVGMARLSNSQLQLNLEPVAIGEIASAACNLIRPLTQTKRQTLDAHFEVPGPKVLADQRRFEQILVNLLSNAHRFTPAGGHISIEVREAEDEVIIAISDTGPGIPEHERQAIFEPFYQGKQGSRRHVPGGMGLGLAIAKSLTELHGGRIWVESAEGGSTFLLAVQRYLEPVPAPVKAAVV